MNKSWKFETILVLILCPLNQHQERESSITFPFYQSMSEVNITKAHIYRKF